MKNSKFLFTGLYAFTLSLIGIATQVVPTNLMQKSLPVYPPLQEHCEKLADRMVMFVIDAGRKDVLFNPEEAPYVSRIAQIGASGVHQTPLISATGPFIKMFATGLESDAVDMFNNFTAVEQRYGSLLQLIHEAGLKTRIIGPNVWNTFNKFAKVEKAPLFTFFDYEHADHFIADHLKTALKEPASDFFIIHFFGSDESAHVHGGESSQYKKQVRGIDFQLGQVLESLDQKTPILVVADHGTDKAGYHFGFEPIVNRPPFVFYSKNNLFKKASGLEIHSRDFGPTVSCILGVPAPAHSRGRILTEILNITPDQEQKILKLNELQLLHTAKNYSNDKQENFVAATQAVTIQERILQLVKSSKLIEIGRYDTFVLALLIALLGQVSLIGSFQLSHNVYQQSENVKTNIPKSWLFSILFGAMGGDLYLLDLNPILSGLLIVAALSILIVAELLPDFLSLDSLERRRILLSLGALLFTEIAVVSVCIYFSSILPIMDQLPLIRNQPLKGFLICSVLAGVFAVGIKVFSSSGLSAHISKTDQICLVMIFPILSSLMNARFSLIGWAWTAAGLLFIFCQTRGIRSFLLSSVPLLFYWGLRRVKLFPFPQFGIPNHNISVIAIAIVLQIVLVTTIVIRSKKENKEELSYSDLISGGTLVLLGNLAFLAVKMKFFEVYLVRLVLAGSGIYLVTRIFLSKLRETDFYPFILIGISLTPLMSISVRSSLYFLILWTSYLFWIPKVKNASPIAVGVVFVVSRYFLYFLTGNGFDFHFDGLNDFIFLGTNVGKGQEFDFVWGAAMMVLKNGFVDYSLLTGVYLLFLKEKGKRYTALLMIASWYLIDLSIRFALLKLASLDHKPFYDNILSAGYFYTNLAVMTTAIAFSAYFLLCVAALNLIHGNILFELTTGRLYRRAKLKQLKNMTPGRLQSSDQR